MAHGVVRTDNMAGTDVRAQLVSVKYMGSGSTATDIDNGCVVKLNGLMEGQREVFAGVIPAATDDIKDIVLIATPELMYDERKHNLDDFYNEAGRICRGYHLHKNAYFGVTADCLNAADISAVEVDDVVELMAGVKLNAVSSLTEGSTQIGTIIAIEKAGRYTYYVVKIA